MAGREKLLRKADALLRRESGTVYKEPGGKINICLVYPNTYHVGMSSLGFQGVYCMLNGMPDVLCERAFLPDEGDLAEFERTGAELFSLESKRPLQRFDAVAFSVSFENDYPNILRILRLAKITPRAKDRPAAEPLLVMGGVMAFSNPEPVADFFDAVFVGEAEVLLPGFIQSLKRARDRQGLLRDLTSVPGVYIPSFYKTDYEAGGPIKAVTALHGAPPVIARQIEPDYRHWRIRHCIVTPDTEFAGMRLVELMRGCPWDCSFCLAGQVYNPPRRKSPEAVLEEIKNSLEGGARVGLIGPSLSDYPGIEEILSRQDVEFSISSLRAGQKSIRLLPLLKGKRQKTTKTLSIAAEAGTDRLRRLINKKVSEVEIIETSRAALETGMNLRLYFIVGLPGETAEDMEGLIGLVGRVRGSCPKGKITLTLSTFVPKPFTCFQWHPMAPPGEVREKFKAIRKSLAPLRGVSVFHDVPKYACMQGVFSMGDRRLSRALELMGDGVDYRAALGKRGLSEDFYIFRQKGFDEPLPWDFIDAGADKRKLWRAFREALTGSR